MNSGALAGVAAFFAPAEKFTGILAEDFLRSTR
jgi:hypothetical protein